MAEAKKSKVDRWAYPDGTPTTKEQRAHLEQHGELPPRPQPDDDEAED